MRTPIKVFAVSGVLAALALHLAARNYDAIFHRDRPRIIADLEPRSARYSIRVEDELTRKPISGVQVTPICGTPYGQATYSTDVQGVASVSYYEVSPFVGARFVKSGYQETNLVVFKTNLVVNLRRIP